MDRKSPANSNLRRSTDQAHLYLGVYSPDLPPKCMITPGFARLILCLLPSLFTYTSGQNASVIVLPNHINTHWRHITAYSSSTGRRKLAPHGSAGTYARDTPSALRVLPHSAMRNPTRHGPKYLGKRRCIGIG